MKMQKSVSVVPLLLLLCLSGVGVTKGQGVEVTKAKAVDFKTEFEVKTPADGKTDGQTDSEPDLWAELRALRDMVVEHRVEQRVEKREAVTQSQLEDVKTQNSDLQAQSVSPPAELSVRLVNGTTSCSGTVEVFYRGEWSAVCSGWWSMRDVMVVCRELHCGDAVAVNQEALVEEGRRGVAIKSCRGHESTITECGFREGGPGYCDGRNYHYVICSDLQAQSVSPPAELSVRLVNGTTSCSGTVEVFYRGEWFGLCPGWWGMKEAKVVCGELDCGNFVDVSRGPLVEDGRTIYVSCSLYGDESIGQCYKDEGSKNCNGGYYHHVTCSESVRLVGGAGLCSGRVEVKSNQSWASVCEADFDRQDAEVVCRDLGCGAPAALQGGLYGEGKGQTWDKEFQCKGNESLLLDCDTSDRENNTCLPGNAVGLTCSEPDDVRLVGGGSRCAGGVERYDQGEWRTVGTLSDVKDIAAVVCRQLGCGSTVSVPPGNPARGFEASCSGSESSLRECPRSYDRSPGLTVICSESVRLVDGAGLCSGRVEVKSDQSWASVCEADFDRQDAEVVCGELGCGAPAALQGGLYGEGEGQTWDKEFQCKGKESLLLDCDTSDRENNICLPGNAVGLTCSEPDDVRLVGGGSRCAGVVERYDQGEWRTVGSDWNQRDVAAVVCRQLGCGSTVSVLPGNTTRGFGVSCSGSESSLRECSRSYDLSPGLTVICSDLLVQPDISLTDSMGGVSRGHQGPEVFRGYSFTITCSTQPQYTGGSFLLTFTGSNRTQTQPAVNHSAAFLFPAADDSHQGNYRCVYDNHVFSHNFSSESELLSLTVTASRLTAFIIIIVVVLLILLTAITTFYLYYMATMRKRREQCEQHGSSCQRQCHGDGLSEL
uniref:Deleted in malignant brain tumors 1 protein-like n=1 Tax=Salmo trutta TaxID=8032 RepID=A0A674BFN6_SALTR